MNLFNIKIQSFPDMIFAGILGYKEPELMFQTTDQDKSDVKVEF